jgi:hypothetical protein
MQYVLVDLDIPRDEWLKIYRGQTNLVYAKTRDGRSIQFPANILSRYTTHSGVQGSFAIYFDASGKFQSIVKL